MKAESRKIEVVVEIENGLVEGIYSTDPDVDVCILDMDTSDTERREELEEERSGLQKDQIGAFPTARSNLPSTWNPSKRIGGPLI